MTDWIFSITDRLGAVGVGIVLLLENLIPPIPPELTLALGRLPLGRGDATDPRLSRHYRGLGHRRARPLTPSAAARLRPPPSAGRQRWLFISCPETWITGVAVRSTRLLGARGALHPVLRSLVSLPAGIANMPPPRFVLLTALWVISARRGRCVGAGASSGMYMPAMTGSRRLSAVEITNHGPGDVYELDLEDAERDGIRLQDIELPVPRLPAGKGVRVFRNGIDRLVRSAAPTSPSWLSGRPSTAYRS